MDEELFLSKGSEICGDKLSSGIRDESAGLKRGSPMYSLFLHKQPNAS